MAHLLNTQDLHFTLPDRVLLQAASVGIDDGDRIGVVGRNGDGKSTLLRILTGLLEPHSGRVAAAGGVSIGYLKQSDAFSENASVRQAVAGDLAEHEWLGNARIRNIVSGLLGDIESGVPGGFDAQVSVLSGGQRRRVALAAVLFGDWDVLILDEPTNHLDVEGVAWLAQHLKTRWPQGRGALLLVTHDRWFLDEVCTTTWEVHGGNVYVREGGYAAFILARAERDRVEQVTQERTANLVRKELAWLRRGAPARTSKPKFRIDSANALIAREPAVRDTVELVKSASARLGKDVFDVVDATYVVPGGDRKLLDNVTWRIGPGDRWGIVGANGAGKSTLLRLLAGDITPSQGRVKRGKSVALAVLSQHLRELDEVADKRAIEAVSELKMSVVVGKKEISASQLIEQLGFTKQRAWTRVSDLSGGERRRLQLARLLICEPNVLMLDEPTNDLDTDTLAAMEDVLDDFAGTMIVVSHDRYLLERIADRQLGMLGNGTLRDLPGGIDEYLALKAAHGEAVRGETAGASANSATTAAVKAPTVSGAAARNARKEAAKLDRQMTKAQTRLTELEEQMAAAATDMTSLAQLHAEHTALAEELAELEMAWLEASELAGEL